MREAVNRAFERATGILTHARTVLERGAKLLLERETLVEHDLEALRREVCAVLAAAEGRITLVPQSGS